MTDAAVVIRALRELARERPDEVELLDGFTDAELDSWPVEVPDGPRAVLREIGGVETEDEQYAFGPRGRQVFADGYWTLGDLDFGEGSLVVGVGTGDWGPVVSLYPHRQDDREVTVEAPEFLGWLAALAVRLADGSQPPAARVFVDAVPSVGVAEGGDAELAALVGRGDPLTDVVDLRELPGYPCGVAWEPYFSTSWGTADTGSSDVLISLAGGGRALLLRSVVSGDFLGRPVRRPALPADAAHRAVAELRELADRHPEFVVLDAGCTESALDAWPVTVPEDIRVLLREIGGITVTGLPPLRLLPGAPELAVDPELHRILGGDGTYWPLAEIRHGRGRALAQVRIDPATGRWGYVVSVPAEPAELREWPELKLVAESLPALLLAFARRARQEAATAASAAATGPAAVLRVSGGGGWLFPNTGEPWPRPAPAVAWASSADPLLAAAAAELPDGAHAADLREVPIPSDLCFHRVREWPHTARLDRLYFPAGGRLAAAVPLTG